MTRIHTRLEGVRARFDGGAQRGLEERSESARNASEKARDAATRRLARDEADRLCADRSEREAIVYASAFLKRVKDNTIKASPVQSPREDGEALFYKRSVAA